MAATTILITSIGGNPGLSFLKCLRSQREFPVIIIGADIDEFAVGLPFVDKFFTTPRYTDSNFIDVLLDIVKKNRVQVLIPGHQVELMPIAKAKTSFEKAGCTVIISDPSVIEICDDKLLTNKFLNEAGVKVPDSYTPDKLPSTVAFPVFLKERTGSGAVNAYKIESREELEFFLKKVEKPVIQSFLSGREFTVDVFCDLNKRPIVAVPRERILIKGGVITKSSIINDPVLIDQTMKIAARLGAIGPINIQCKLHEGQYYFFEINSRLAEALVVTLGAGVNFGVLLLRVLNGKSITAADLKFRPNTYMARFYSEVFIDETTKELVYLASLQKSGKP